MNEPICAECAHLVGVRTRIELAREWKCGHTSSPRHKDIVSGAVIYDKTCYEARVNSGPCGAEGRLFEKYERPELPAPARGKQLPSADDLLGELDNLP